MDSDNFGFSFKMEGIDRQALLEEAAERLDALRGPLGKGPRNVKSAAGKTLRAFKEDEAYISFPEVYKITDKDFLSQSRQVPVPFKQLARDYDFYWVRFPIFLRRKRNWVFHRLEMLVEFNPDDSAPHTRPKAYQILPEKQFRTLLKGSTHLEVRLNENFVFSVKGIKVKGKAGAMAGELGAAVDVTAAAGMGMVVGPFIYHIKCAEVDHTDIGNEEVFWHLDGTKFFQEHTPPLIVIAQVPKGTKKVEIATRLHAYTSFDWFGSDVRQLIEELPRALQALIKGGAPTADPPNDDDPPKMWDITPRLQPRRRT